MSGSVWYISVSKKKIEFKKYPKKKKKQQIFNQKSNKTKAFLIIILFFSTMVLFLNLISAAEINDTFHINVQTTFSNGTIQSGTFAFAFNITENSSASCLGPIVYNHSTSQTTDSRGIVSIYLPTVGSGGGNLSSLSFDRQYYLCYYRDGTLKDVSQLGRVPYSFRATQVNLSEVSVDSNLTLGSFNVSGTAGFFTFLGSLVNRITTLFVQDINASGDVNVSGIVYSGEFSGPLNWTFLQNYPTGCGAGEAVQVIGDTLTCVNISSGGGTITGAGTAGYIPVWNDTTSINNSAIYQNGSFIGIGSTNPIVALFVNGTINTPKITVNNTNVMTIDQWNATNTSYALNQTLTDMWSPFLNTTNLTYLMIDRWNATNTSYRTLTNYTFLGNVNISESNLSVTQNVTASWFVGFINASNVLNAPWLSSFTETDPLAYNGTLAYNQTLTDMWSPFLNTTNLTYLIIDRWNATNTSYALNQTLTDMWSPFLNTTNLTYLIIDKWNATNTSYYLASNPNSYWNDTYATFNKTYADTLYSGIGNWNATNTTYREKYNLTWVGDLNATGTVYSAGVNNLTLGYLYATNRTFLETANWNATNVSYALNQTLTDMWSPFLNTTNLTYLMIDRWNATNESYLKDYGDTATGNYDFNGGWQSNGLSIIGGDIYAQTGFFVNITSLNVSHLNINGSLLPQQGFDNQFDVGNATQRWRDFYFGRNGVINGTLIVDGLITGNNGLTIPSGTVSLPAGEIGTTEIADAAITSIKVAANAINTTHIVDGTIAAADIAASAINTTHILDNTILPIDLSSDVNATIDLRELTNTTSQIWTAIDNGTFRKLNNYTFLGNVNISESNLSVTQNVTASWFVGFINASNVLNAPWLSSFTEADPKAYNGTLAYNQTLTDMWSPFLNTTNLTYLLIDQWNATNTSYALNQTLTDMWSPFLNTTNLTYLTIDRWNATNTSYYLASNPNSYWNDTYATFNKTYADTLYSGIGNWNATNTTYREKYNLTWVGDLNATGTVYSAGVNNLTLGYLYATNRTFLETANWNATNTSYALNQTLTDMWSPFLNTTNLTYLMIDRFNVTNTSYLLTANWNATNTSYALNQTLTDMWLPFLNTTNLTYLMIDRWNATNTTYREKYNISWVGLLNVTSDINSSGTIFTSNSFNLTKAYFWVTNGTFLQTANWNATNTSYALNQTLTDMWLPFLNTTNLTYLMIDRWNATNTSYRTLTNGTFTTLDLNTTGVMNASAFCTAGTCSTTAQFLNTTNLTYLMIDRFNVTNTTYRANYNISWVGLLNVTSDINSSGTIFTANNLNLTRAYVWVTNGTFLQTANWNATNTSYALNQTLTDMWTPFLSTTNSSYLLIDRFNTTNTTYREKYNLTWVGNLNSTATVYSEGINNLTISFLFNSTGLIRNWNISGDIQNWNASTYIRNWGIDTALLNTTNLTYLMIDRWNATNTTYREKYNISWVGLLNVTSDINSSGTIFTSNSFNLTKAYFWVTNGTFLQTANWNATNESYLKDYGDTATGNYTFDTNTFFIDSTNHRVGIGTASPQQTLNVQGTFNATNNGGSLIVNEDGNIKIGI